MRLVLDASMTLAWLFERDTPQESNLADRVLGALQDDEAHVPWLWHTEVVNALLVAERRGLLTEAHAIEYLSRLSALPIITDDVSPSARRDAMMGLAREHGLTAYDATYLELALRLGAVVATFDRRLAEAVDRAGGSVLR